MEELKALLGDAFKDEMTPEEIQETLINQLTRVNAKVAETEAQLASHKDLLSKRNSEIAKQKKELEAKMTEEELAKQQAEEKQAAMLAELEDLRRESSISKNFGKFIKLGYSEDLARETAEALVDGDTEKVFANQEKFIIERDKLAKENKLKSTPTPPPSGGANLDDNYNGKKFKQLSIQEAAKLKKDNPELYTKLRDEN